MCLKLSLIKDKKWSVDAGVNTLLPLYCADKRVSVKTIYNYIDLCLLSIQNIDLPMKTRINRKKSRIIGNKKVLGNSIENRLSVINNREEFGHWEINNVIGRKNKGSQCLLTLVERKMRYFIAVKLDNKTCYSVNKAIENIKSVYNIAFDKIFKSVTSDKGVEFSKLNAVFDAVYYAHPHSSFEKGTNERHNGLLRRFVPRGKDIGTIDNNTIESIINWCNTLPKKILNYKTPYDLFYHNIQSLGALYIIKVFNLLLQFILIKLYL